MDGGAGAARGFDGYEGATSIGALGEVNKGNVEEVEMRFPWRTLRWEFAPDTCGAGRWRGASGIHWEVQNMGGEAGIATGSSDGEHVRAPGALGGEPTPNSRAWLIRDGETTLIRGHRLYQLKPADIIRKVSGGGAGVGVPAEREPEKVRRDVRNDFISLERAREVYRVALDRATLAVDEAATRALRATSSSPSPPQGERASPPRRRARVRRPGMRNEVNDPWGTRRLQAGPRCSSASGAGSFSSPTA